MNSISSDSYEEIYAGLTEAEAYQIIERTYLRDKDDLAEKATEKPISRDPVTGSESPPIATA